MTTPNQMQAIVFDGPGRPLRAETRAIPQPGDGQLLLDVKACGVCRTDLHLLDGEVSIARPPRVLGHQIVGIVEKVGPTRPEAPEVGGLERPERTAPVVAKSTRVPVAAEPPPFPVKVEPPPFPVKVEPTPSPVVGERVGVPWLGWTCGTCEWCLSGRENLCPRARFTGRDIDGGTVVCGGIHMSDIPSFPYEILWGERSVRSVANLTRRDAAEFLSLAPKAGVHTQVMRYELPDATQALADLRAGRFNGAAVLVP